MNLAVFLPNWIGDVVMATPALRALRDRFPHARFTAVCKPYVQGVLSGSPWFQNTIFLNSRGTWSERWPAAAYKLRRENIDLAVLFANTFRSALVARLAGAKRRVGYARYGRGWLLTDRFLPLRDTAGNFLPTPIIDDYNRLATVVGAENPGYRMELYTTPAEESQAEQVWESAGFSDNREVVALNPGAAFGSSKFWRVDSFARLARDFVDRRDSQVLVLCGPAERDLARQVVALTQRPGVVSVAEAPLSLGLTKALVRRSTLLVTTDSGPRHFAAAFGKPVVTLFGPTHIEWTETYYERAIHLQKKVPCGPCQKRVCPLDHRCMNELLPSEVFQAATRLLEHSRSLSEKRAS